MTEVAQRTGKPWYARWWGIALLVLLGLAVLGALLDPAPQGETTGTATSGARAVAPVRVTAQELFAAFEENQVAAGQKYNDKPLLVSGTVQAIDEQLGSPALQLTTGNEFMPLNAIFPVTAGNQLAAMRRGQQVTIRCGRLRETVGFLALEDCSIAS